MPQEWIREITGLTTTDVQRGLRIFLDEGEVFYVYTPLGKTIAKKEHIPILQEEYEEYFKPEEVKGKVIIKLRTRKRSFEGGFNDIYKALERIIERNSIDGLRVVIREERDSIEYIYTLSYNFRISDKELLRIVLKNAFSKKTYQEFG